MKVLDPQAALLSTAEVYQFLQSNKARPADKKIGSYTSVNLNNYNVVRQDVETYIQTTTPFILEQPSVEAWMTDLLSKLKKYQLYKSEVFALINLGIGRDRKTAVPATSDEADEADEAEDGDEETPSQTNGDAIKVEGEEEEGAGEEVADDTSADIMLFGLIVEDSDERFPGEEGEQKINEIIAIFRDTIAAADHKTNGVATNGT